MVEILQRRVDQPFGGSQAEGVGQEEMILDEHLSGSDADIPVLQDRGIRDPVLMGQSLGAQPRVVGDADDLQWG